MSYIWIDESIHERGGFILAAAVHSERDVSGDVLEMARCANVPEFQSGSRMTPDMQGLRDNILSLVQREVRFGAIVVPTRDRQQLGNHCVVALEQFIRLNQLGAPTILFDEGIVIDRPHALDIHLGGDSRSVGGIQVADCLAHCLSTMLLCALGFITKLVVWDPEYSPEPGPLDFGYFAVLRRSFFIPPISADDESFFEDMTVELGDHALYVSDECDDTLRLAAKKRLGRMFLGCMH